MDEKHQILTMLREEFSRWEGLLGSMDKDLITAHCLPSGWSIKDVIAHLMAWQQVSIARLKAAKLNKEPVYPDWLSGSDPESEEERELFNARIYELHRQQLWSIMCQDWRDGFLEFLRLGEEIPENDLYDTKRYPWLKGYSPLAVLQGSYEHHHEHWHSLMTWITHLGAQNQ